MRNRCIFYVTGDIHRDFECIEKFCEENGIRIMYEDYEEICEEG